MLLLRILINISILQYAMANSFDGSAYGLSWQPQKDVNVMNFGHWQKLISSGELSFD
jgi:hypothetical protein